MEVCSQCGTQFDNLGNFCSVCGTPAIQNKNPQPTYSHEPPPLAGVNPHHVASRGFAQLFGLHPAMAFLTVASDLMLHAADVVSGGLLIPFSALAGVVLGIITFMAQRKWYNDDNQSAIIKALIVALLTAIPSPLPYVLFVPAGLLGFFRRKNA